VRSSTPARSGAFLPGPDVHVDEMYEPDAPLSFVASLGLFAGL